MTFNVKAFIKKPDSAFESVILTSAAQIKELIGVSGSPSQQIHTAKGFSVYANPEADGAFVGHTVDYTGSLRYWAGVYVVAKYKGTQLLDMDETDLDIFTTCVLDKGCVEEGTVTKPTTFEVDYESVKASLEARNNGD